MVFDGVDGKVSLGNPVAIDFGSTTDFSIGAWVKTSTLDTTDRTIIGTRDGSPHRGWILQHNVADKLRFKVYVADGSSATAELNSPIADGELHHVMGVCDRDADIKLYVDGSLLVTTSTATNGGIVDTTENEHIGYKFGTWEGIINEVSIFTSALSLAQVQELFNDGVAFDLENDTLTGSPTLAGYWRNDGAVTWTDRSANSNDGTVTGSPDTIVLPEGTTSGKDILGFPLTHTNNGWLNLDRGFVKVKDEGVMVLDNSPFTVEFWLKRHGVNLTDKSCYPLGKYRNSQNNWSVSLNKYDDLLFWAEVGNVACIQCQIDATGEAQDYHDEDWHHFAFTAERETADPSTKLIWYVDGTAYSGSYEERLNTITSLDIDADLGIGTYAAGSPDSNVPVPQTLDEVRIYKRALSATEVLKNYNHGLSKHSN